MDRTAELVREWMHKAEHDVGMALLALEKPMTGRKFLLMKCSKLISVRLPSKSSC